MCLGECARAWVWHPLLVSMIHFPLTMCVHSLIRVCTSAVLVEQCFSPWISALLCTRVGLELHQPVLCSTATQVWQSLCNSCVCVCLCLSSYIVALHASASYCVYFCDLFDLSLISVEVLNMRMQAPCAFKNQEDCELRGPQLWIRYYFTYFRLKLAWIVCFFLWDSVFCTRNRIISFLICIFYPLCNKAACIWTNCASLAINSVGLWRIEGTHVRQRWPLSTDEKHVF